MVSEDTWQAARLIPISGLGGHEERERRATSALLAVLGSVKEFNRALLSKVGAHAGTVSTFCEVPFDLADGRKVRVDGVIRVSRGKRTWTMLVEVKTGTSELGQEQVENYLDVAKEQGFNGLLTISNQIVSSVGQFPVRIDKRRIGRSQLYHISWTRILTIAHMVKEHQGVSDPDQAWILGELIRYLEYEGSGALAFDDMGPNWVGVRSAARDGTLRLSDDGVREVGARWDQLVQFLCFSLGARLGQEVKPVLSKREVEDSDIRPNALAHELVDSGTLSGSLVIPNAVGPIYLNAYLRRMDAEVAVVMEAPDLKQSTARLNWLLRQLRNAPEELRIDVRFPRTRTTASELLGRVIENPSLLLRDSDRPPRSFVLTLSARVGTNRKSGRGGFITDVSALLDRFYHDVIQGLKEWTPPAPKLQMARNENEEQGDSALPGGEDEVASPASPSTPSL